MMLGMTEHDQENRYYISLALSQRDIGWGSAGCVEIIGDFGNFKQDIRDLGGISSTTKAGEAISNMAKQRMLFVEVQYAVSPTFKNLEAKPWPLIG